MGLIETNQETQLVDNPKKTQIKHIPVSPSHAGVPSLVFNVFRKHTEAEEHTQLLCTYNRTFPHLLLDMKSRRASLFLSLNSSKQSSISFILDSLIRDAILMDKSSCCDAALLSVSFTLPLSRRFADVVRSPFDSPAHRF